MNPSTRHRVRGDARPRRGRALAIAAILVAAPSMSALHAQEVPLEVLLAAADSANPRIAGARRVAEAATAAVPQAGALPDPMVGIGLMNVPVANPSLGREMMTMAQVQLGATLPWPGKLGLREDVARLDAEAAAWEVARVRDEVRADVESTYVQIYFVDRALEVTERNERLLEDLAGLTSAKYAVGTAAQPDVLKAQVERTRLVNQVVALRERRTGAVARLNALLARPTATPIPGTRLPDAIRTAALAPAPLQTDFVSAALTDVIGGREGTALPSVTELQAMALAHSPMIQAHLKRVSARARSVTLAEAAKLPDLSVTAGYSRRAGFADFFNVTVSAPIPIFSGRKQDQRVVQQAAVLEEHRARNRTMVDGLNADIASLHAELERARAQLVLLDEGILPQARTGLASATSAYQVGRVDFLTLLDAQVTLYRQELDYHRLLADFATNLAALERAVGTEVLR